MTSDQEACRREAKVAVSHVSEYYTQLRDRLEELAVEHDDEQAAAAWRSIEDHYSQFDDVLAEAQEAIDDA